MAAGPAIEDASHAPNNQPDPLYMLNNQQKYYAIIIR